MTDAVEFGLNHRLRSGVPVVAVTPDKPAVLAAESLSSNEPGRVAGGVTMALTNDFLGNASMAMAVSDVGDIDRHKNRQSPLRSWRSR